MGSLDADHSLVNIFHVLATPKSKARMSTGNVHIPETVSYQHGSLRYWYHYEHRAATGVVCKDKRDCTPAKLEAAFTRGVSNTQGVPVATFLYKSSAFLEDPTESNPTVVEFMDAAGLREFLHQRENKPDGILQKFVPSRDYNNVAQIFWTPHLNKVVKWQNTHKLSDHRIDLYERCVTHEGRSHYSKEVICSQHAMNELSETCKTISKHYYETEHKLVTRLVLYFKYNIRQQLVLLYPSAIVTTRFKQPIGRVVAPSLTDKRLMINLNPSYTNGTKPSVRKQLREMLFQIPSGEFFSPSDYFNEDSELNKTSKSLTADSFGTIWAGTNNSRKAHRSRLPLDRALALISRSSSQYFTTSLRNRILGTDEEEAAATTLKYTRGGGGGMYQPARKKVPPRPQTAEITRSISADQTPVDNTRQDVEVHYYQVNTDEDFNSQFKQRENDEFSGLQLNFWSCLTTRTLNKERRIRFIHSTTTSTLEDVMYRCYSRTRFGNSSNEYVFRLPKSLYVILGKVFDDVMSDLHFQIINENKDYDRFMSVACDSDEDRTGSAVWVCAQNEISVYCIRSAINNLLRKVKSSEDYNLIMFFEEIQMSSSLGLKSINSHSSLDGEPVKRKSAILKGIFSLKKLKLLDTIVTQKISNLSESVGVLPPILQINCQK